MIFASPRASLSGGEHCKSSPPRDVEDDKSDTCTEASCEQRYAAQNGWTAEEGFAHGRLPHTPFPLIRNGPPH